MTEFDLFGMALPDAWLFTLKKRKRTEAKGYVRRPGSGPAGETCGSCVHCVRVQGGHKRYPKCKLAEGIWTHGPGSDIRTKSPACEMWQHK